MKISIWNEKWFSDIVVDFGVCFFAANQEIKQGLRKGYTYKIISRMKGSFHAWVDRNQYDIHHVIILKLGFC